MRSLSRTVAAVLVASLIATAGISAALATPPPDDLLGVMDLFELESAEDLPMTVVIGISTENVLTP